jgi:hypothetical protein
MCFWKKGGGIKKEQRGRMAGEQPCDPREENKMEKQKEAVAGSPSRRTATDALYLALE